MRLNLVYAGLILLFSCTSALADVACVQQGLTDFGMDPGPVDGKLGTKTLDAALAYMSISPSLDALSVDNAHLWCEDVRRKAAGFEAGVLSMDEPLGSASIQVNSSMDATPVLGKTPEYEVPDWVNNPH